MIRTALKGLAAHKLRMAMTALAVVLGVAFVSGSLVFTDTIDARFNTLFNDVYAGVDATVRPDQDAFGGTGMTTGTLSEDLVDDVATFGGVRRAAPTVGGVAQIIDANGNPIGGQGPPTIGGSWVDEPALSALRIEDGNGRAPEGPGEVVIDVATAEANAFEVGDRIDVQVATGVESFTLVGLANFGSEDNLAGATMSVFEFEEAQRLFDMEGRVTQIDILAADDVDADTLVEHLAAALPEGVEAVTGDQQTQEQLDTFTDGLGFLSTALLAFAAVAVFVGAFIIQNTFRIIVAQRTRELALLRAIGATARQVVTVVTVEALAVGVAASALGVVVGIGFSSLLKAGMDAAGFGMPDGPLTVTFGTVTAGMTVGIVVTLVSALLPARKAARIAPVAAMRDVTPSRSPLRSRAIGGTTLVLAGGSAIVGGLFAENGATLALVGLGSLLVFLGVSVLAPLFARPIAAVLGAPLRGITGTLARENTRRQPRRTAATASALMIGVALVGFVAIFGASIKASVGDALETAFPADLAFQSTNFTTGVSDHAVAELDAVDELTTLSSVRAGLIRIDGQERNVAGIDGATIGSVYSPRASIDLTTFEDGVLVHEDVLTESGWTVGQTLAVEYPAAGTVDTTIVGTFQDQTFSNFLLPDDVFGERVHDGEAMIVLARIADDVELDEARAAAETALAAYPSIDINTASEQAAEAEAQIDQMLALFSGLLGLAVIIAVVGIANTLALSIVERTREIGLLRAVGMNRRQVRRMIRWESVITALFGAVLGIGLGLALGWTVVASLADDGLGSFSVPTAQLAVWLAVAAFAGIVAAIGPARSASKMKVLEAIAYE